ncbi:hypothetical protein K431DRAFT_227498 [Polychaeton citri CBS 116435]|uniref:Uncharacterized protein n=1 Tax=Polychaeton citri CBS 116435 TaxID=1314669 RepID=A0A9P4UPE3_9PEZI|nr:hypothetical protein K431DRAFT_227498 [Polychaeton citri CBS 116435]
MSWDVSNAAGGKRGVKRLADESNLNDEQRFAKRFNLLNAQSSSNSNSNYYIPLSPTQTARKPISNEPNAEPQHVASQNIDDEHMQLDDTKDKVYIHNLDDELADIEAHETQPRLIFLPDIEKKFSRIPQHVLTGNSGNAADHNQELVLYSVPKSLTVDEGHDNVRKAIIEARRRAQEKSTEDARQQDMMRKYDSSADHDSPVETAHGYAAGYEADTEPDHYHDDNDEDAMDTE